MNNQPSNIFDKPASKQMIADTNIAKGKHSMSHIQPITDTFDSPVDVTDKMQWLIEKITFLEAELKSLKHDGWMTLPDAAKSLNKSVSAIRQRIKHPTKPMPEQKVWRQESKGCEIWVHLDNFRKYA